MLPIYLLIVILTQLPCTYGHWENKDGMWFYFSDEHFLLNYQEAMGYCEYLGGNLITISTPSTYGLEKLLGRQTERWIGLSTIQTNHTERCDHEKLVWADDYDCFIHNMKSISYNITSSSSCSGVTIVHHQHAYDSQDLTFNLRECSQRFGFICQWQCRRLFAIPALIHGHEPDDVFGQYLVQSYNGVTKYYTAENSKYNTQLTCFNNSWRFISYNRQFRYYTSDNIGFSFVPYAKEPVNSEWNGFGGKAEIAFVCSDCQALQLDVKYDFKQFYKTILYMYDGTGAHFMNSEKSAQLSLRGYKSKERLVLNVGGETIFFDNHILPVVDYSYKFIFDGNHYTLSCISTDPHEMFEESIIAKPTVDGRTTSTFVTSINQMTTPAYGSPNHMVLGIALGTIIPILLIFGLVAVLAFLFKRKSKVPSNDESVHQQRLSANQVVEMNIYSQNYSTLYSIS